MSESAVATDEQTQQQETDGAQAQSVEFTEVSETIGSGKGASLDILLDMEVPVTVVVGRKEVPIQRLLQLSPGSVLKLDRPIDVPVDLYLKDARFATGHIVVVEDKFAVRIKEIVSEAAPDKSDDR